MNSEQDNRNASPGVVKLVFNPIAGAARGEPIQLTDVIHEMQKRGFIPELYLIEEDCDLPSMVRETLGRGIDTFAVCGGDGTVSSVARALMGTKASLGIIPAGTRNNMALSLSVPEDVAGAVELLRTGRRVELDVAVAICGGIETPFLEVCSLGLASALFPAADDIQHGNLMAVGEFVATLVGTPPAEIRLVLDGEREIVSPGHVVVVSNMPYVGPNYWIGPTTSFNDGLLDVVFFGELSKLDLLGHIVQGTADGGAEDPRVQHFQVRTVEIISDPPMPAMADGIALGEGSVRIEVRRSGLTVIGG